MAAPDFKLRTMLRHLANAGELVWYDAKEAFAGCDDEALLAIYRQWEVATEGLQVAIQLVLKRTASR